MLLVQRAQRIVGTIVRYSIAYDVKHPDSDEAIQLCSMESHKGLRLTDLDLTIQPTLQNTIGRGMDQKPKVTISRMYVVRLPTHFMYRTGIDILNTIGQLTWLAKI